MERQFFFLLITVWTWLWISNFFSCMFKNQSTIRKRQKKEQAKRFCLSLLTFGLACFLLFVFAVVDFKKETRKQTRNVEKKVCGIEKPWHYSKKTDILHQVDCIEILSANININIIINSSSNNNKNQQRKVKKKYNKNAKSLKTINHVKKMSNKKRAENWQRSRNEVKTYAECMCSVFTLL